MAKKRKSRNSSTEDWQALGTKERDEQAETVQVGTFEQNQDKAPQGGSGTGRGVAEWGG